MSGFEELPALIAAMSATAAEAAPAVAATAETAGTSAEALAAAKAAAEAEASLGGIDALQAAGRGGMSVAQQGIGPGSLGAQFSGLLNNPASAFSSQGMPANLARGLLSGGGSKAASPLVTQMGMGLLNPQQPPQQPRPQPMGGGQVAPMQLPYQRGTNSLDGPPPGMTMEEWLRRKQMMGRMQ